MANVDSPFGLYPSHYIDGTPWNGQTIQCYCSASYATALYVGDPVLWTPTLAEKDATCTRPTINVSAGTSGTIIRGVITSFEPSPTNLSLQYRPASTERVANVVLATPYLVFRVQDDGDGTPAAVWAGQNAVLANVGGGSTTTGLSGYELDASTTPTTTQAHTLHILGLANIPGNTLGDYAIWDVILNTCMNSTGLYLGITAA